MANALDPLDAVDAVGRFERRYLELFWEQQRRQWENYADDARHELSRVDDHLFQLARQFADTIDGTERRDTVARWVIDRLLVDQHPDVARLRNRLDEHGNYDGRFREVRDTKVARYRLQLARAMKPDVLELMTLRQELARDLGYASYPSLVLAGEEIEYGGLIDFLEGFVAQNLPAARALIEIHGLSWTANWFEGLERVGCIAAELDSISAVQRFLDRMGYGELGGTIPIVHKQGWGYVGVLSVPGDVRILVEAVHSLKGLTTLYHELGHAVAHALNEQHGMFKTWSALHDESMAVLLEHVAALWCLDDAGRDSVRSLDLLENVRTAISALFEYALWERPDAAEELFLDYYGRIGLEIESPEIWAADSFRSIDPVYIHSYAVGWWIATHTTEYLTRVYDHDLEQWGVWLRRHYYAPGRSRSLWEKTAAIGDLACLA